MWGIDFKAKGWTQSKDFQERWLRGNWGNSRKYPHTPMDDTELGTQKFQDFREGQ